MIYFNIKSPYGIETIDELNKNDFNNMKEFRLEVKRLVLEYHIAGINVYKSSRCTKDWKNR